MTEFRKTTAPIICAALCLYTTVAQAGPCSEDIAQFEAAMRRSAGNPNAGLTAPQSVGAELGHQPTPGSLKRTQERCKHNSQRQWPVPNGWMLRVTVLAAVARFLQQSECIFFERKPQPARIYVRSNCRLRPGGHFWTLDRFGVNRVDPDGVLARPPLAPPTDIIL